MKVSEFEEGDLTSRENAEAIKALIRDFKANATDKKYDVSEKVKQFFKRGRNDSSGTH